MSDNWVVWLYAAFQWLAAAIIATYWITWFRAPHTEPWLPPGYVQHERAFVFSDSVLSALLVAGGILQVLEQPVGRSLGLISAGMLAFLGILDLGYYVREGMLKREHEGIANGVLIFAVFLLAVLLGVRFA